MPFPQSPTDRILDRMVDMTVAANLHTEFGLATPFTVRHFRNRNTTKTERPAIAFRLVSEEINPEIGAALGEVGWAMTVDIVVDMNLRPEGDLTTPDESGWNQLAGTANRVANLFLDPSSQLLTMVDDTLPGDKDPDEDSTPDEGRLVQSILVLYRTLRSDLNHLLNSEENAP